MTLQKALLDWFHKNARPLPWRRHYRPYEVWVSEIMLQQTQVETALPYYTQWLKTFPTIASLAKADEKKVLKMWQGLGYYSRARNLHANAKLIMDKYKGIFPKDFDTLLSLKGIGRYTAGAIASIAFNETRPIVDGNVLRVLSRVFAVNKSIDIPKNKDWFWLKEEELIPHGKARFFNQAVMELGALICAKQNPLCGRCPIQNHCLAFKQNKAQSFPVRNPRKKIVKIHAASLILHKNEKFLIQKRPVGKIMGGLWEFPEWKLSRNRFLSKRALRSKMDETLKNDLGIEGSDLRYLSSIKRSYTHHLETLEVFYLKTDAEVKTINTWPKAWVSQEDFKKYPFSSAHAKITQLL